VRFLALIAILISCSPISRAAEIEEEFKAILAEDNRALTEITKLIERNPRIIQSDSAQRDLMAADIRARLNRVRTLYSDFLRKHPDHTRARIAFGSFLTHLDDRQGAENQWRKALDNNPSNAAALNNIATHIGAIAVQNKLTTRIPEAFDALEKAIRLSPKEPLYRHNLATLLSLYRKIAAKHYRKSEKAITLRAITQLQVAAELSPEDFEIASDLAETYHDLSPIPLEKALKAWGRARDKAARVPEQDWTLLQRAILLASHDRLKEAETMLDAMDKQSHPDLSRKLRQAIANRRRTH